MSLGEEHLHEGLSFFIKTLLDSCRDEIVRIILFGSQAKGSADESSDVDVLVVHAGLEREVREKVAQASLETMLRYHLPLEPLTMSFYEHRADNPFVRELEETGKSIFSIDPSSEREIMARDYYALAIEWLKYAKSAYERSENRLAIDSSYNAAELAIKALIVIKEESLARSHGGILDQFGKLYILSNEVDREVGRQLHEALILRNRARYDPRAALAKQDASQTIAIAEKLIRLIELKIHGR